MEVFLSVGNVEIFVQLLLALCLGALLGTERTVAHKTAGLRTFGLVSLGSALFVIIATMIVSQFGDITNVDLMRVVAGVITGVGFLGAGAIIFRENTVTGMTTAAGIWVAAGIGVAVGFKLYSIAISATILTLLAFTAFWWLETYVRHFADGDN